MAAVPPSPTGHVRLGHSIAVHRGCNLRPLDSSPRPQQDRPPERPGSAQFQPHHGPRRRGTRHLLQAAPRLPRDYGHSLCRPPDRRLYRFGHRSGFGLRRGSDRRNTDALYRGRDDLSDPVRPDHTRLGTGRQRPDDCPDNRITRLDRDRATGAGPDPAGS